MGSLRTAKQPSVAGLLLFLPHKSYKNYKMKLLSELLSLSSWNSTSGSLELGKKDLHSKYTVKEQLGKGGFGVVYSAVRRSDGLEVAVKEVSKDEKVILGSDNIPLEVALMQQVQDVPGVIKLLDYFEMNHCYFIVMERFHCKDLFDFISEQGPLPETLAKDLFKQILQTIMGCHKRGIVHRDIKDENILIDLKTFKTRCIRGFRAPESTPPQSGSTQELTGQRASPSGPWASSSTTWCAATSPSSATLKSAEPSLHGSRS